MKKCTHFNYCCTNPFIKRFILLITLAVLLNSCGSVIQAPLPTKTVAENSPTIENPATLEPTAALPTEEPTQTLTITPTPETTAISTQGMDFAIPEAPQVVDPEKWTEAYINGMQTNGYIKLKVNAGIVEVYWDQKLNTLIWDLGTEKFGYNSEFEFTGSVVGDVYGNNWIVRKKLFQSPGYASSIWGFDRLHVKDSSELIVGVQCNTVEFGEYCAMVGIVTGKEKFNFSNFVVEGFENFSEYDKGVFTDSTSFIFDCLKIRIPGEEDVHEFMVPVVPENLQNLEIMSSLSTPNGELISGEQIMNSVSTGSMIYFNYVIPHELPEGMDIAQFKELFLSNSDEGSKYSIVKSFGMGSYASMFFISSFNEDLSGNYSGNWDGSQPIFSYEALLANKIAPLPNGVLLH